MSTHDEDRLARGLHERAGDVPGAPVGLDDVKRSARGIRRRRRVAGGLVAAAVVAIAVPVGLNAAGSTSADRPVAPATTSPSGTPTRAGPPSPLDPAEPGERDPADRGQGARPATPRRSTYLRGRTVRRPDGDPARPAGGLRHGRALPRRLAGRAAQAGHAVRRPDRRLGPGRRARSRAATGSSSARTAWRCRGWRAASSTWTGTNGHSDRRSRSTCRGDREASPVGFVGPGSVLVPASTARRSSFWVTDFRASRCCRATCSRCGPPTSAHGAARRRRRPTTTRRHLVLGGAAPTAAATGSRRPATGRSTRSAPTARTSPATRPSMRRTRLRDGRAARRGHREAGRRLRAAGQRRHATSPTWPGRTSTHVLATAARGRPVVPRPARPRRRRSRRLDEASGRPEESPFQFAAHP